MIDNFSYLKELSFVYVANIFSPWITCPFLSGSIINHIENSRVYKEIFQIIGKLSKLPEYNIQLNVCTSNKQQKTVNLKIHQCKIELLLVLLSRFSRVRLCATP